MREWLELTVEILTPAFVAGADQKEAEFRAASVKGLLRWWWRALVGHQVRIEELARREAAIFGSSEQGLKSPLHVSVKDHNARRLHRASELPRSGKIYQWVRGMSRGQSDILPYLAFGPVRLLARGEKTPDGRAIDPVFNGPDGRALKGPRLMRQAIAPGTKISIRLAWLADRLSAAQIDEVVRAACAWTTLGGIGSRSRKGWGLLEGSIQGASTPGLLERAQGTWNSYRKVLIQSGQPLPPGRLPDFPQLEYRIIHKDRQAFSKWEQALGSIGLLYKQLMPRGNGRWITGSADPRRASSLLIALTRDPDGKLRGSLCLLPCKQAYDKNGEPELRDFMKRLSEIGRR